MIYGMHSCTCAQRFIQVATVHITSLSHQWVNIRIGSHLKGIKLNGKIQSNILKFKIQLLLFVDEQ